MTDAVVEAPAERSARVDADLARTTATITVWNLVSRITGFARVLAMGAALGATALGDTYQSANLVSNILFELLAGGMLSSVLVPAFVELLDAGRREDARQLAGALTLRAAIALAALAAVGMVFGAWVMRLLTVGVEAGAQHDAQVRLGAYLLWFFLPQLVLYAVGAVATALLNADRRFVAAAIAPAFNNVVVVATMVVFRAMRGDATGLAITTSEKLVLGLGTTLGVVAMTVVPLLALRRGRLFPHIRWHTDLPLHAVARRGAWAVGHLGLNQLLMAATIVLAARVSGGVVAFQIAFTFFLLPHAVLSNPIYTVLYPRLAGDARVGRFELFADDLGAGCRYTAFVLLPAAALLAALAAPALTIVHFGALDEAGARLVAAVLAAYAAGLLGYSGFFLLTRAAYALDDVKGPTIVNFWVTVGAITGMVIASAAAHGEGRVIVLGLVHAIATALGSWALLVRLRRRLDRPVPVGSAIARDTAVATVAGVLAWLATHALDMSSRTGALLAIAIGAAVGGAAYLGGQRLLAAPELTSPFRSLAREPV